MKRSVYLALCFSVQKGRDASFDHQTHTFPGRGTALRRSGADDIVHISTKSLNHCRRTNHFHPYDFAPEPARNRRVRIRCVRLLNAAIPILHLIRVRQDDPRCSHSNSKPGESESVLRLDPFIKRQPRTSFLRTHHSRPGPPTQLR